jgi:Rps23 Pro-64 3,4-dihydroxylase Tpa1-like proline 4-hydroxylase
MTILTQDWGHLKLRSQPFPWVLARPGELIAEHHARELAETFPVEGMVRLDESRRSTGKRYRNHSWPIRNADLARLPTLWRKLVADLRAPSYRTSLAMLLEQPTARSLEIRLVLHGPDDWLGPHTDLPGKLFTQIFYFNSDWLESDGGWLELLTSDDPGAVAERVLPTLGTSVVLLPSDRSWHQVVKVSHSAPVRRQSLLVHAEP